MAINFLPTITATTYHTASPAPVTSSKALTLGMKVSNRKFNYLTRFFYYSCMTYRIYLHLPMMPTYMPVYLPTIKLNVQYILQNRYFNVINRLRRAKTRQPVVKIMIPEVCQVSSLLNCLCPLLNLVTISGVLT